MLASNAMYSSQPKQEYTAQSFLDRFEQIFTRIEYAQAEFSRNPIDPGFMARASTNIVKLTTLLALTGRRCSTDGERTQLSQQIDRLKSIAQEHERLILIRQQTTPLHRAQSARVLPTQESLLQQQKHSSFSHLRKPSQSDDLD